MRPLNGPSIKVQRIGTRKDKAGTQTGKRNIIVLSIRPAAVRRSLITPAQSHLLRAQRGGNQAGRQAGHPIAQSKCITRFGRGVDAHAACAHARVHNFDRHETSLPARPPPTAPSYCPSPVRPSVCVCPSSICWLRPRRPSFLPSGLTSNLCLSFAFASFERGATTSFTRPHCERIRYTFAGRRRLYRRLPRGDGSDGHS